MLRIPIPVINSPVEMTTEAGRFVRTFPPFLYRLHTSSKRSFVKGLPFWIQMRIIKYVRESETSPNTRAGHIYQGDQQ